MVNKKCDIALKELSILLGKEFNIKVSTSFIQKSLKSLHYSFKRVKLITHKSISGENIHKRELYSIMFQDLVTVNPESNIFLTKCDLMLS